MKKNKILLIDNDPVFVKSFGDLVISDGFQFISSGNASDGLQLAQKEEPGLILLEILSGKMDSFVFLEKLKHNSNLRKIPVIVLTGKANPVFVERSIKLGAADYYIKNADVNGILKKVKTVFELDKGL